MNDYRIIYEVIIFINGERGVYRKYFKTKKAAQRYSIVTRRTKKDRRVYGELPIIIKSNDDIKFDKILRVVTSTKYDETGKITFEEVEKYWI